MGDLKNPKAIYAKAVLFLVAGTVAGCTLLVQNPTPTTAFLIGVMIWSFCRLYYFAFYVIEHYVDGDFRFSGIIPLLSYVLKNKPGKARTEASIGKDVE